jgi:hypothetical protein
LLREVSEGRANAYELLAQGLQAKNSKDINAAEQDLAKLDQLLKDRQKER